MHNASEEGGTRSWWQTLPGMITAVAGLITAITGLVVVLQQVWPESHSGSGAAALTAANAGAGSTTEEGSGGPATLLRVALPAGRRVRIGDLQYDFLQATASAGNPDETILTLRVRMTNNGRYPANFWNATFRLRALADTSAPTNFLDDVVDGGTTDVGDIVFSLAASVRRATLLVGDDHAKAVELPIVLSRR